MKATTSDKVGYVAAAVLCIIAVILALWPWWGKGKKKAPVPTPPPQLPADQAISAAGTNALASSPVNGDTTPPVTTASVPEPAPKPAASASGIKIHGDDSVVII